MLEVQSQELGQEQETNRSNTYLVAVIDRCLDKGIALDGWASVRVAGIDLLTLDFYSFVASFEKYLEYADAVEQTAHIVEMDDVEPEELPLP